MGEEKKTPKPILRFFVWEAAAAYGLMRLLQGAPVQDPWTLRFVYNACFFLAAYPMLALWNFGGVPGFLRFILFPVGWALKLGMVVSAFLWALDLLWSFGCADWLKLIADRPFFPGVLYFLLYLLWISPLWGVSGKPSPPWFLARLSFLAVGAGGIGYLVGRGLDVTLATRGWEAPQRLWLILLITLLFACIGALAGRLSPKD